LAALRHRLAQRPRPGDAHSSIAPDPGGFELGAVVGSAELWELPWLQALGARTARLEFDVNTPASQLAPVIEGYARAGIHPLLLAGFTGRMPSSEEARNVAGWAAAYGPGGTFWRGRSFPAGTAVTDIEFGNETNNPWQFGDDSERWWEDPGFIQRAEEYARRVRDARAAIASTGASVGLLAIAAGDRRPVRRPHELGRRDVPRRSGARNARRRLDHPPLRP
jgi:hypothetical protein